MSTFSPPTKNPESYTTAIHVVRVRSRTAFKTDVNSLRIHNDENSRSYVMPSRPNRVNNVWNPIQHSRKTETFAIVVTEFNPLTLTVATVAIKQTGDKPSFVIFDIRTLWRLGPHVKLQMPALSDLATVGVKGLKGDIWFYDLA